MGDTAAAESSANIAKRYGRVDRIVSRWWWQYLCWGGFVVVVTALVSGGDAVGVAEKKVFAVITVWGLVLEGLRNGAACGAGGWGRRSYIRMRGPATWVRSLKRQCPT